MRTVPFFDWGNENCQGNATSAGDRDDGLIFLTGVLGHGLTYLFLKRPYVFPPNPVGFFITVTFFFLGFYEPYTVSFFSQYVSFLDRIFFAFLES